MKPKLTATIICAAVAALAACSSGPEMYDGPQYAEAEGWEWPLTVERIGFECPGGGQLVVVTEDGSKYAGNGLAKGEYDDIAPIWKDDPDVDGLKVDIGELIEWGNSKCGY